MKNNWFILLTACTLSFAAYGKGQGEQREKSLPQYTIVGTTSDKTLKSTEAVFDFDFYTRSDKNVLLKNATFEYSCNAKRGILKTDAKGKYALHLKPGKYKFQFFYTEFHREVYTDSIEIGATKRTHIQVYFDQTNYPVMAEKPVIYLYPEKTTEVSVQLAVKGNMLFTYPTYNNGWKVTAEPNGTLKQGDKTFNYLFWEANIPLTEAKVTSLQGTVVEKNNLLAYLENTLAQMGLTSRESQDFITYWYPRMMGFDKTTVRFMVNEEVNTYAELDILPKPDHVLRIFMVWSPGESATLPSSTSPNFPVFKREGFTVVEWGGMQANPIEPISIGY